MQATITYLLTKQAQRAQMAATGQPVARKQTMIIDVTAEDLPLLDVSQDGQIYLDLATPPTDTRSINLPRTARQWRAQILGGDYCSSAMPEFAEAPTPAYLRAEEAIYDARYAADVLAHDADIAQQRLIDETHIREAIEYRGGKRRDSKLYRTEYLLSLLGPLASASRESQLAKARAEAEAAAAARAAKRSQYQALIDAFFADFTARAKRIDSGIPYWIDLGGTVIHTDTMGQASINAVATEARRREEADRMAKEDAKTAAIDAFVAGSGDIMIQQQYADGLLCRQTIVSRMATSALDSAGLPAKSDDSTVCDDSDCPCHDNTVDCIPPAVYARWKALGLPDDTTVAFHEVLNCTRDENGAMRVNWNGDPEDQPGPVEYHAIVTVPSGPFQFTRRIKL